ncbi:hypothetical protein [Sphingobium olei]|uniref:Lipoprotein n=1 Tax=Sphingobium olei TaxID=420955 RepID=A0ABW3NZ70_9SPHN
MRMIVGIALLLALSGCGGQGGKATDGAQAAGSKAGDESRVDCFTAGMEQWARDCTADRDGEILTLRHPDGGFRRFHILADGHGLEAADGAEAAKLTIVGKDLVEVVAGSDRYRLPVQVAGTR